MLLCAPISSPGPWALRGQRGPVFLSRAAVYTAANPGHAFSQRWRPDRAPPEGSREESCLACSRVPCRGSEGASVFLRPSFQMPAAFLGPGIPPTPALGITSFLTLAAVLSFIETLEMTFGHQADTAPGLTSRLKIRDLITPAESLRSRKVTNSQVPGIGM